MRVSVQFLFQFWDPIWFRPVCAATVSVRSYVCLEGTVSLVSSILRGVYNLSASFSPYCTEPWGKGIDGDSPLSAECFVKSLTLCTALGSTWVTIYFRRKLLWWRSKILIYEYGRTLLGIIILLCSINRRIAFDFSPRCMDYLVSGSWPPEQYQAWVLSLGLGLKSSQIVVGYFITFVPLLHAIMQAGHYCRLKGL